MAQINDGTERSFMKGRMTHTHKIGTWMIRLLGLALLVASFIQLQAQQTTGSIVGTVKDQQGAVVNTATVKATNVDTGSPGRRRQTAMGNTASIIFPWASTPSRRRLPALSALCNRISPSTWTRR